MLEGHGDDLHRYDGAIRLNFSSNVRSGGTPPGLARAIQERFEECSHYPEPEARSLAAKIARHHGVDPASVMVTSGSVEAIHLLGFAYRRKRAAIAVPTFSEYADACRIHEIQTREIPRGRDAGVPEKAEEWFMRSFAGLQDFQPDLFFLCNPNNPTGDLLSRRDIRMILEAMPGTLLVVDEAYMDFVAGKHSALPLVGEFANLALLRSLTKSFAIPGIRLGYLMASPEVLERIRPFRTPWSVGVPAVIAGEYIMDHYDSLLFSPDPLIAFRERLSEQIAAIPGFFPRASETHYILVRTERGAVASLKEFLAREKGILIRDASNFAGIGPGWFRVAARSEEENLQLIRALESWHG